ncbi:dTMP kinase [Brevibacillus humidisoli]|uniref:dTMP kinase n=1 Tax=Brevibacillus humidisoli TaxID=2895522 RepID=UPI001E44634A|nr:dTMP kinase [Brevibacillus humidisoli]UFJ40516.1 dTMP kinase [Brevibacillus humidisoli]
MTGLFITFEGPDGAGKTTQVEAFSRGLRQKGYDVLVTREPGGTPISDKIRSLLLDPAHTEMTDATEVLLYAASRAQHVQEKVIPALQSGRIVVCDRFVDASIAYQGYGLGLPVDIIAEINRFATAGLKPDRTYLLDLSVSEGRSRLGRRDGLDRIEQKGEDYHQRVRDGFQHIARQHPERIRLVDADRSIDEVHEEIMADFWEWQIANHVRRKGEMG